MSFVPEINPRALEAACRALVSVNKSNLGFEVQLPVIYPSGDFTTVVVSSRGEDFVVHDAGFAAMTLADHAIRITGKLRVRVAQLAAHYGCDFSHDRMTKIATLDELPLAVAVVANASRTIADQMLQSRHQPIISFKQTVIDKVKQFVGEHRVRENEPVIGSSGTQYSIGAVVLNARKSAPIALVEAVRDLDGVNKRFREFYDISLEPQLAELERVVMYDDSAELRQGDLILLQNVSNVVRFSDAEARFIPWARLKNSDARHE